MAVGAYSMAILVTEAGHLVLARAADRDPDHDGLRAARRPALAAPARRLLRDRDDRAGRGRSACSPRTPATSPAATRASTASSGFSDCFDDWLDVSDSIEGWHLRTSAGPTSRALLPLLIVVWVTVAIALTFALTCVQQTPWGRVLRAVREDEDAARALGKNALRLQAPVAGDLGHAGRDRRLLPRAQPGVVHPTTSSRSSPSSPTRCWSSAGLPATGASRSARSSSGRCSRDCASSTCRFSDEPDRGAALRRSSALC